MFQPKYNGPEEGSPLVRKLMLFVAALLAFSGTALFAQKDADLTGVWQGTLNAGQELRIMFKISKGDDGGLEAIMYSIDQTPTPIASTITVQGPNVKVSIPAAAGRFDFELKWTPDESQFGGRGGSVKHDEADAPPSFHRASGAAGAATEI